MVGLGDVDGVACGLVLVADVALTLGVVVFGELAVVGDVDGATCGLVPVEGVMLA